MGLEAAVDRRTDWLNMECPICGKRFHLKKSGIPKAKVHYCSRECHAIAKQTYFSGEGNHQYGLRGNKNASWNGGRKKSNYGYWLVQCIGHPFAWRGQDYVFEHRLVAEKYLLTDENSVTINGKRYLSPDYIVHHKNGIKTDNRPENLKVMRKGEHSSIHSTEQNKTRLRDSFGRYA